MHIFMENKWKELVCNKVESIVWMCRKKSFQLHQFAWNEYCENKRQRGCLVIVLDHIQEIHRWIYSNEEHIIHAIKDYQTEKDWKESLCEPATMDLFQEYDPENEFILFCCISNVFPPNGESAYCFEIINKYECENCDDDDNENDKKQSVVCFHCQQKKHYLEECQLCRLFLFCSDECKENDTLHSEMCSVLHKVYTNLFMDPKDEQELILAATCKEEEN